MVGGKQQARAENADVGAMGRVVGIEAVFGDGQFGNVFYVARTAELRAISRGKGVRWVYERLSRCQDWGRGHTENHPSHRAYRV